MTATPIGAFLHVALLTNDDLPDLSDSAFRLWTMGLVKAAAKKTRGVLRVKQAAAVQRWACLAGGKDAVAAATSELIDAGWWIHNEDGTVTIHNWDRWHAPVAALLDAAGPETTDPAAMLPALEPATGTEDEDEDEDALPALNKVGDDLIADLDDALLTSATPSKVYGESFAWITENAEDLRELYRNHKAPVAYLQHRVLDHAVKRTWGDTFPRSGYGRLHSVANAEGASGAAWLAFTVLTIAGQRPTGDPVSYLAATMKRLRKERQGTRA